MALRVDVSPELLEWAVLRSGRGIDYLAGRFPGLQGWLAGTRRPTLRQLETFAEATYTPVGYLFLANPPDEDLPLPDFRTAGNQIVEGASVNLLDTIYQSQIRQEWYRGWASGQQADELPFVGSLTVDARPLEAARAIHESVRFSAPAGHQYASWTAAVTGLADALGDAGILVMINGVVGSNTSRALDPREFRGFSLVDSVAPLVFVNGADAKAAQLFTLAHEAAHVWLGSSGVDNAVPGSEEPNATERWCNAVAAEFLVPLQDFRVAFRAGIGIADQVQSLARRYRVSNLAILTRAHEAGYLGWDAYRLAYVAETERAVDFQRQGEGGNFYSTLSQRLGKRFLRAVVGSTQAGETLYPEAFRMLGIKDQRTFDEIPARVRLS